MQELWFVVRLRAEGVERGRVLLRDRVHLRSELRVSCRVRLRLGEESVSGAAPMASIARAVVLAVGLLFGCGSDDSAPGPSPTPTTTAALCAGAGEAVAFSWRADDCCGQRYPGQDVMFENGVAWLSVEESCAFEYYDGQTGRITRGSLDEAQRVEWERALPLAMLHELATEPTCGSVQYLTQHVRFEGRAHTAGSCGVVADKLLEGLTTIRAAIDEGRYVASATPAAPRLRFTLLALPVPDHSTYSPYNDAPSWPLATDPTTFSVEMEARRSRGPFAIEGDDAARLRELRNQYLDARTLPGDPFVPVVDARGGQYQLWARDVGTVEPQR